MEKTIFSEIMEGITMDRVVRDQEYSMPMKHFHDTYELYFLLEGERHYFIEKQTYYVKTGDVVLINREQVHKTSQAGSKKHDRILLQLSGRVLEPWLKSAGLYSLERIFDDYYGVTRLTEKEWDEIKELLLGISEEMIHRRERYEVMVRLKLSQILLMVCRSRKKNLLKEMPQTVQTAKHGKVHEVAEYLTLHCETGESLEELSESFFISKSYLSRIFREVTGFSVNEYRNLARVRKARELLAGSGYSITEISEILGFESVTYFERVFKKHTDMTPLKYRKDAGGVH
ncbi:AraC family transcriptional regulator [Lacrimispora indolis]|uniref:AraC family transcriptional regulator n=1 Tax=Lacrimispora indolis TaxID=69825 RepID=UPI0003F691DD|nr:MULTISPECIES: AraC family transcriptional regulator [Lachnospiraceae]MBE7722410.1 helix-turn-helix domain-containing protein [Lacrimispora celerecrescens]